jgi:hypothetical protein
MEKRSSVLRPGSQRGSFWMNNTVLVGFSDDHIR